MKEVCVKLTVEELSLLSTALFNELNDAKDRARLLYLWSTQESAINGSIMRNRFDYIYDVKELRRKVNQIIEDCGMKGDDKHAGL